MSRWRAAWGIARRWWAALLVLGLLLIWAIRSADLVILPFMPDTTWARVQREGVLRVGTDASYPPLAVVSEEGAFSGLDVDLAQAIADEMGVGLQLVNIHWDGLFDALHAGKVDLVISAVPYDGTLTRDLSYSVAYADLGLVLVAPTDIAPAEGLAGQTVAVELGSEAHLYAKRLARESGWPQIIVANSASDLTALLTSGAAEVVVCDRITGGQLASDPRWRLVLPPVVSEPVHIVTARKADSLTAKVDATLAALAARGELEAINDRWLGGTE